MRSWRKIVDEIVAPATYVPTMSPLEMTIALQKTKVGNEMLYLFLHDAMARLKPGGRLYVVTITGLRQFIKRSFNEVFGNYKKHKQGPQYTVAMAVKK